MSDRLSADKLAGMTNAELTEVSSQITGRLHNQDWQNIVRDLQASGHIHTVYETAPPILQRFIRLEIDLDKELVRRVQNAPLMSSIKLEPQRPRGTEPNLRAILTSQDGGASMEVEVHPEYDFMTISFGYQNLLTLRFNLNGLDRDERRTFLEMARRDSGLTVLWTPERWEQHYLVFVRQEFFSRVFAYSDNFEATARLTDEVTLSLLDWLDRAWFARERQQRRKERGTTVLHPAGMAAVPAGLTDGSAQGLVAASRGHESHLDKFLERLAAMDAAAQRSLMDAVDPKDKTLQLILEGLKVSSAESREALKGVLEANPDLQAKVEAYFKKGTAQSKPDQAVPTTSPEEEDPFTW